MLPAQRVAVCVSAWIVFHLLFRGNNFRDGSARVQKEQLVSVGTGYDEQMPAIITLASYMK